MSFSISPGVYTREIDMSTSIPAVATSVGVLALRKTFKGPEHEQYLVSNVDELISAFGEPTDTSFMDIMSGIGFLKYGKVLYCTRVMPEDATFSGTKILSGYSNGTDEIAHFTFDAEGTVASTEDDGPYTYASLGADNVSMFPEQVDTLMGADEPLWIIANSRGAWGDKIRVIVYNLDLYNAVKYFDTTEGDIDLPSGTTITDAASAQAISMYNEYVDNPDYGDDGYDNSLGFSAITDYDTPMTSDTQFTIIVQAQDQGSSTWEEVETFIVSSDTTEVDDSGSSMFVEDSINETSDYIRVALNPTYKTTAETDSDPIGVAMSRFSALDGGQNGVFGRHDDTTIADGEDAACIDAYELYSNPEEIDVNLFIDAGKNVTVKEYLISICEDTRKDSFAVLDVLKASVYNNKGSETLDMVKWRKGQGDSTFNPNSSYAALYGNWLEVFDSYNKTYRWIPASGYMAGLYANTDDVADAWWAPAGLNRAILTNVRRLAFNPTEGNRDTMYVAGINPIVSFSGQGKVVWGQKTLLDKSSAFNRINVRRLFLVLEKGISKASKYYLFEQNDEITWMLMTNMIEPFLRDVKGRRGLYDYMVIIDETTNTDERIDRNELWGSILLKPTRVAEYIRLSFVATKTSASFTEIAESV